MSVKSIPVSIVLIASLFSFGCSKDPQAERVSGARDSLPEATGSEKVRKEKVRKEKETQDQTQEITAMPTHQIYVEGKGQGLGAEVRLNDLPIGQISADGMRFAVHSEFSLLPGENTFTLIPSGEDGTVAARVASYELNEPVDGQGGDTLLELTARSSSPVDGSFTLSEERPRWSWMDADHVDNKEGYEDAIAFSKSFYKTLTTGDMEKILPVLQPVHNDMSKLTPDVSVEVRNQESTEGMQNRLNKPIWQFDDIEDIEFNAIPIANGKLYLILRKDGTELFRTSQESRFDRYTFYKVIGRKNGVWAFYR